MPLLFVALVGAGGRLASAEDIRLSVTADTSIAAHPSEEDQNNGGSTHLKMKGIENIVLLLPDCARILGKRVVSATLHLRATDDRLLVRKVGVSTVATPWMEGAGHDAPARPDQSCFRWPGTGGLWGGPGSNFLDAVWGRGGTAWRQVNAGRQVEWYAIAIDGSLLEACASGLSYGLAVSDDNGQTMAIDQAVLPTTNHANNNFFAREQNAASAPYVTVALAAAPDQAPPAAEPLAVTVTPWADGADAACGAITITWPAPPPSRRSGLLGYRVRVRHASRWDELPRWQLPHLPCDDQPLRALLRGQPPAGPLEAEVLEIGPAGAVLARGAGAGSASPARAHAAPLVVPTSAAPQPAPTAAGAWALPDLAQANPITGNVLEDAGGSYAGAANGSWRQANPVWDGASATISLRALRGEWVAVQLMLPVTEAPAKWRVALADLAGPGGARILATSQRLARAWYIHAGPGSQDWYADPLVPLDPGQALILPSADDPVPQQRWQALYLEMFVPRDAQPGQYHGAITLEDADHGLHAAPAIALSVGQAEITAHAAFALSLNAYDPPGDDWGRAGTAAFLAAERSYHVLCHEHRATLAVVGYSHSANFALGIDLPLAGSGDSMRVADWSAWDARFGPLFDGTAFAHTTRAGEPYDHFYLPFMESWPTPMSQGYRWNGSTWEDHWRVAGSPAEGFNALYQSQWVAVLRDFGAHAQVKGWRTHFLVYLNDKYYYKQYDPKLGHDGRGTSFWLLDEPMHIDDFAALAFFAGLTRAAQAGDREHVWFRADISRPQWGRDLLDRGLDLQVTGGYDRYGAWLRDWRERHGQRIWTYGGTPACTTSASAIVTQLLDLYARGVDGYVPWLVLGDQGCWSKATSTCVVYSGRPRGLPGACPSLRLKAYRRAEEDIEYLRAIAARRGLLADDPDRLQVLSLIGGALGAHATQDASVAEHGGVPSLHGAAGLLGLEALRAAMWRALQ